MIREAVESDLPQILGLSKELFLDPSSASDKYSDADWPMSESGESAFRDTLESGFLWVVEENNKVVGFICADIAYMQKWRPIKRVELISFYIEPDYRSSGVGSSMAEELFKWAKDKGAKTVFVSAYVDNVRGIEFYRNMGFRDESLSLEKEL
jgi:ribosomal protein S18 acetylase RimI-like enzyme